MATRSAIIAKEGGNYWGVYCHNDGYISGVGATLYKHYTDLIKVHGLLQLGSLSSIGPTLDTNDTCAYHRDRGEEYFGPVKGKTIINVAKKIDHNGYVYVYEADDTWMVWLTDKEMYLPLDEALEIEKEPEPVKPKEYNCIHCGKPIYPTWYGNGKTATQGWKHKASAKGCARWGCGTGNYAAPPAGAIWTEPKIKQDGAE
jgi:hypothetical protein